MAWVLQHKKVIIASVLIAIVVVGVGVWFWGLLVEYIEPKGPTGRKDLVQVFALIIAGIVGVVGAIVGFLNVRIARRNLDHNQEALRSQMNNQREIEEQRAQEDALQSYFEQMGDLLTDHKLIDTDREDIRHLARAQTLTVLARLDGARKGALVRFLHGAGLINNDSPIIIIVGADLTAAILSAAVLPDANLAGTNLSRANLSHANLGRANLFGTYLDGVNLSRANLSGATLVAAVLTDADLSGVDLIGADLSGTILWGANLSGTVLWGANLVNADFNGADLRNARVNEDQLVGCKSLEDATMPNGQKYEDWLKTNG